MHQRIQKPTQNISPFAPRPFAIQTQQDSQAHPTQQDFENKALEQDNLEAFGLQLKEKHGTIAPVEQQRLGVLQAKRDEWAQKQLSASRFGHNLSNITVHPPDNQAIPVQSGSNPIQRACQPRTPEARTPIQAKLTIGQPNDKYEQEADRVAAQIVRQINAPVSAQPTQQLQSGSNPIQRACQPRTPEARTPIQAKLTIGQPNDKYEQEADRVAAQIVRQINAPVSAQPTQQQSVQRQNGLKEKIQASLGISALQRREAAGGGEASTNLESAINSARGGGQSLDAGLQQSMGQAMGADFSGVKVHTDSQSDQLNRSIQAKAFTTGQDVFFRQGAYQPESRSGQELIAHELTHVVQQNGGGQQSVQRDISQIDKGIDDDTFDYGENTSASTLNTKTVLKKRKTLYQAKGGGAEVQDAGQAVVLKKGALVEVLEQPSKATLRHWAKVKAKGKEGWINTENSVDAPASGKIAEHSSAGVVMPNGVPTVDDVKQMMFGDCFLLAALTSLVQKQSGFIRNNLFQTDPTQDVAEHKIQFHKVDNYRPYEPEKATFTPENVTIKNTVLKFKTKIETDALTVDAGTNVGSAGVQSWPAIVEKAFALWPSKSSFPSLKSPSLMSGGEIHAAAMFLTGASYKKVSVSDSGYGSDHRERVEKGLAKDQDEAKTQILAENRANLKAAILDAFANNPDAVIGAGTPEKASPEWARNNPADGNGAAGESKFGGIVFGHAYSIVAADANKIHLRNPWGRYSRVNGQLKETEAVSILTWDEFYQTFDRVTLGV